MPFTDTERRTMLALKGVGATVITRLEEVGFDSLAELKEADATEVTNRIAVMLGVTCWRNSPQAKTAIQAVISLAKRFD